MRRRWLGAGLLLGATVSAADAQAGPGAPVPQIVTSATGEVAVVPDRARVILAVEVRAPTAAAAGTENARRQKTVIDAVRARGVAAEQISTRGYSVAPIEKYGPDGTRTITGYQAQNSVVVDVHRIEFVGAIIDAALGAGANHIGGLELYSTKFEAVRRQALEQAVQRARGDADVMAKAAGGSILSLLELQSVDHGGPRPVAEVMMVSARAADQTPIAVGEQRVTVSVTAKWSFVQGR